MKIKVTILALVIIAIQTVSAWGGDRVIYSSDYFTGDASHAATISSYFSAKGHSSSTVVRPTVIYGINTNLINSDTVYISTHGVFSGSKLVLTQTPSFYSSGDVTSSVNSRFIYYSACYSAKTNTSSGLNLCSTTIGNGASAVMGYTQSVTTDKSRAYELWFYSRALANEENVYTAYVKAKALFANTYGTSDAVYTSISFFGDGGLYIY